MIIFYQECYIYTVDFIPKYYVCEFFFAFTSICIPTNVEYLHTLTESNDNYVLLVSSIICLLRCFCIGPNSKSQFIYLSISDFSKPTSLYTTTYIHLIKYQFHVKKKQNLFNLLFQKPQQKSVDVYNHVSSSYLYGNYVFAIVKKNTPIPYIYVPIYIIHIYYLYIIHSYLMF